MLTWRPGPNRQTQTSSTCLVLERPVPRQRPQPQPNGPLQADSTFDTSPTEKRAKQQQQECHPLADLMARQAQEQTPQQ